mmetsp:Transcript_8195/g.22022  ORF Transcript_8195/g.22022 Transcript_8195/m.22022 type:complete len:234 (-) Transcript_8195:315-1016(-)
MFDIPPPPPEPPPPPTLRMTYNQAPIINKVGKNLAPSAAQFVSDTYWTGTKSRGSIPSWRCAASSLRSKISTEPIAKWYDGVCCGPLLPILGYRVFGCSCGGCCCESHAYGSRNSSVFSACFVNETDALGLSKTSATFELVTIILSTSPDSNSTVANSCQLISVPWFSRLESQTPNNPRAASAETTRGPRSGGKPPPSPPPPELLFFVDEALAPPLVFLPAAPPFVVAFFPFG